MMKTLYSILTMLNQYHELNSTAARDLLALQHSFTDNNKDPHKMVEIYFDGIMPIALKQMFITERINQLIWVIDQLIQEMPPEMMDNEIVVLINEFKRRKISLLQKTAESANLFLDVNHDFKNVLLVWLGDTHGY